MAVKKKAAAKRPAARARPARKKAAAPKRRKDGRPAQWWPALAPYMTVRDGQSSIEFYARAFGFEAYGEVMRGEDGQVQHAGMRLGEAAIMFAPPNPGNDMKPPVELGAPDSLTLYVYVPDVDALAARAQRAGAKMLQAPADQFWGDRIAVFKDPDGYHWTFATNVGEFDASKAPH
jgi:uncharacterized glyoxalase superfamily protein PhnB